MLTAIDEGEEEEEEEGDGVEKVTSLKIWSAKQIWRCTFVRLIVQRPSPGESATVDL